MEGGSAGGVVQRQAGFVQPAFGGGEVVFLAEGVEAEPEAETVGKGDFFFHGFLRVHLAALAGAGEVVGHVLGHEVAAVGGGVHQHIVGAAGEAAV